MTSPFSNLSPETLRDMRNDLPPDKVDSFQAAVAASGLTMATPPDPEVARLHANHAVVFEPKPERYDFPVRADTTLEVYTAKRTWSAKMQFEPDFARAIIERVEQLAPEMAAMSDPRDRNERIAQAQKFVGGEARYNELLAQAREALAAGGEFKLLGPDSAVLATDPWLLSTLANYGASRAALTQKLADRRVKK